MVENGTQCLTMAHLQWTLICSLVRGRRNDVPIYFDFCDNDPFKIKISSAKTNSLPFIISFVFIILNFLL